MLSDRELRAIRKEQEEWLPDTVTIQRATRSSDGFGGHGDAVWADVASDVPARITKAQTLDMGGQAGRKIEIEKWTVRLPHGTEVREFDRIVWTTEGLTIRVDEIKHGSYRSVVSVAGELVK